MTTIPTFFSLPCHLHLPFPWKNCCPRERYSGGMIVKDGETEAKFNKSLFVFHQVDETNLNFSADILYQALQYTVYIYILYLPSLNFTVYNIHTLSTFIKLYNLHYTFFIYLHQTLQFTLYTLNLPSSNFTVYSKHTLSTFIKLYSLQYTYFIYLY